MSETLDQSALEAEIGRYFEPNLRQTLAEARAVRAVLPTPAGLRVTLELGFPVGGYRETLAAALMRHLAEAGLAPDLIDELTRTGILADRPTGL